MEVCHNFLNRQEVTLLCSYRCTYYLELSCLYLAYLIKIKGTGLSHLMDGLEGVCLAKFCLPLTNSFKFCISRKSANFSFTIIHFILENFAERISLSLSSFYREMKIILHHNGLVVLVQLSFFLPETKSIVLCFVVFNY